MQYGKALLNKLNYNYVEIKFKRFVGCYVLKSVTKLTEGRIVLLEKLVVTQLVNKLTVFYETRRFITVFTKAHHWSLS
jgi:hypothetical protein